MCLTTHAHLRANNRPCPSLHHWMVELNWGAPCWCVGGEWVQGGAVKSVEVGLELDLAVDGKREFLDHEGAQRLLQPMLAAKPNKHHKVGIGRDVQALCTAPGAFVCKPTG